MAAAPFCGLLGTLRDAAGLLEPERELPTLRAFADLAMEFQAVTADAPPAALAVSCDRPASVVKSHDPALRRAELLMSSRRRCCGTCDGDHPVWCTPVALSAASAVHTVQEAFAALVIPAAEARLICRCRGAPHRSQLAGAAAVAAVRGRLRRSRRPSRTCVFKAASVMTTVAFAAESSLTLPAC